MADCRRKIYTFLNKVKIYLWISKRGAKWIISNLFEYVLWSIRDYKNDLTFSVTLEKPFLCSGSVWSAYVNLLILGH